VEGKPEPPRAARLTQRVKRKPVGGVKVKLKA